MRVSWIALSFALGSAASSLPGLLSPQEPAKNRPPAPPAGAPLLPTIEEPWSAPVIRSDLFQRFEPRDVLEGFYELRGRVVAGAVQSAPGRGWVVLGRRHMLIYLLSPGPKLGTPLVQASVRLWARQGEQLRTSVLAGHYTEADGDLAFESSQVVELRRYEIRGGMLRIWQGESTYLDFGRVE
jgi:hypothetical protein